MKYELVCDYGPYGLWPNVQHHRPAHKNFAIYKNYYENYNYGTRVVIVIVHALDFEQIMTVVHIRTRALHNRMKNAQNRLCDTNKCVAL